MYSSNSNKLADIAARLNQKLGAPAVSAAPNVSAYGVNPGRPSSPNVMQNIMKPKSALGFGVPGLNIGPDSAGLITINTTVPDKFVGMCTQNFVFLLTVYCTELLAHFIKFSWTNVYMF